MAEPPLGDNRLASGGRAVKKGCSTQLLDDVHRDFEPDALSCLKMLRPDAKFALVPVIIRPVKTQVDDLIAEVKEVALKGYRSLVTVLTKRMAEDLIRQQCLCNHTL